jgi:hypothetical protein
MEQSRSLILESALAKTACGNYHNAGTCSGRVRYYHRGRCSAHRRARIQEHGADPRKFNRNPTVIQGGGAMAKRPTDFAQQNTERAFEVTSYSLNWMREMAERNLNQSKAALEDLLTITRKAVDDMDHQAAVIREHSISVMEETLSNTFDFAHKLVHMKEPQELAQLQSEFVSRQAQVVGNQTKELGHSIAQGASEVAKTAMREAAESSRRQSAAA